MRIRKSLVAVGAAIALFGSAAAQASSYHGAAKPNYRCNEFTGASKSICMRNQERALRCSGLKGMKKRECMEKTEPYRGTGSFRRFSQ